MNLLHKILSLLTGFALIVILLFTSVQAIAYWIPGYYRHEFSKYNVAKEVKVEMGELLRVTDEMMSYLDGSREHLHDIKATIDSVPDTLFFNEREVQHMEDVRVLFRNAIVIRRILIGFVIAVLLLLMITKGDVPALLAGGYIKAVVLFFSAFAVLMYMIFRDFSAAFIQFHHLFFRNDLWILDPATDNLIVIVPEGFFFDTAMYIGCLFTGSLVLLFCISLWICRRIPRKH